MKVNDLSALRAELKNLIKVKIDEILSESKISVSDKEFANISDTIMNIRIFCNSTITNEQILNEITDRLLSLILSDVKKKVSREDYPKVANRILIAYSIPSPNIIQFTITLF